MISVSIPDEIRAKYDRIWIPHPGPQTEVLTRMETEILYGGARGGGKTDAGIVWLTDHIDNPRYRALVVRKNSNDLADWIDRAGQWYIPMGAKKREIDNVPSFVWPSGAIIRLGHLKDKDTYTKYQGHEYQRMLIEEATQIPDKLRYVQLIGSCRSTVEGIKAQVFLTANPGNIGHAWVKERFIDPAPPNTPFKDREGRSFIYIPSTIDDNPTLKEKDPGYVRYLESIKETDENLYRAWRFGDWSIFVGQVFSKFRPNTHVIPKLPVPLNQCKKIVGFDWGYNAPGAAVYIAVTPKNRWGVRHYFQYREIYQNQTDPEEWAEKMNLYSLNEQIDYVVLPHDCYSEVQGHKSIESIFKAKMPHVRFIRGKTLSRGARHQRVAIMQWVLGSDENEPESIKAPRFQILSRCTDMVRTLPLLVYDENDIEDIDTDGEDHLFDAASLALMTEINDMPTGTVVKTNSHYSPHSPTFQVNKAGEVVPENVLELMKKGLQKR